MKASRLCAWSSLALAAWSAHAGAADGVEDTPLRVQAFAAASVIGTTNNNFFGDTRDDVDTRFSELGVNAIWQPHERLRVSGQALHRRAGESDEEGLRLDYAQIDWTFYQGEQNRFGLKFGKPKLPYGLYNETRDVPFTRPGILLPQSIYYDSIRDFVLAAPGAYLHGTGISEYGAFEVNLGVVRPNFDTQSFKRNFFRNVPGTLDGRDSFVASVRWDAPTDTTLALYRVDLNSHYSPAPIDPFGPGDLSLSSWLLSAQQRIDTLTLTAELALPQLRRKGFNSVFVPNIDGTIDGQSWYAQAEWRFHPAWEAMLRFDQQYSDTAQRDNSTKRARDLTAGLRWDVAPNFMLRAEYHHIDGTGWLPAADNVRPPGATPESRWNMWLLQAAYRF